MRRTRIKICGLTREQDVAAAVEFGADALGLVFYPKSPRYVSPVRAGQLLAHLPAFVNRVGLFVNADEDQVRLAARQASLSLLQFHGDESVAQCVALASAVGLPFIRAARIEPDTKPESLLQCEHTYSAASGLFSGLLLDTHVEGYGGAGKVFDWSLVPKELAPRVVLSGGLSAHNITEAVLQMRPFAVDVSSGVESAKGIKDADKMRALIAAVRLADAAA
jgi:phosphoribosylanthranilate isomerase